MNDAGKARGGKGEKRKKEERDERKKERRKERDETKTPKRAVAATTAATAAGDKERDGKKQRLPRLQYAGWSAGEAPDTVQSLCCGTQNSCNHPHSSPVRSSDLPRHPIRGCQCQPGLHIPYAEGGVLAPLPGGTVIRCPCYSPHHRAGASSVWHRRRRPGVRQFLHPRSSS